MCLHGNMYFKKYMFIFKQVRNNNMQNFLVIFP